VFLPACGLFRFLRSPLDAIYAASLSLIQITSCLTLEVFIPRFKDFQNGVLSRLANLIARYSFGIYLSHMPLRWFCFEYRAKCHGNLCTACKSGDQGSRRVLSCFLHQSQLVAVPWPAAASLDERRELPVSEIQDG
jgi:hypothetical protein